MWIGIGDAVYMCIDGGRRYFNRITKSGTKGYPFLWFIQVGGESCVGIIFGVERKVGNVCPTIHVRHTVMLDSILWICFVIMQQCIIYRMVKSGRFVADKERKLCNYLNKTCSSVCHKV